MTHQLEFRNTRPLMQLFNAPQSSQRFVVFDRDNTLIVDAGYTHQVNHLRWRNGALDLLRALRQARVSVLIATNQSGVARGYFTLDDLERFHAALALEVEGAGGYIDAIVSCPHHPRGVVREFSIECRCRKPRPGLFVTLMKSLRLSAKNGLAVGDKFSDQIAGNQAGLSTLNGQPAIDQWADACLSWGSQ